MSTSLSQFVAGRDLLVMLTWRDIRIKYKQSIMGMLWAILMPAVIVSAGILVRAAIAMLSDSKIETADVASVSVRAVPWAFFVASIRFGAVSLITNASLVTKIYVPREVFPVAAMLSQLVDFGVATVVLIVALAILGVGASVQLVWVPVLVLILIVFITGLAILLSAASLFFRDVKYLVEVVLTFAIFFTPVFYDVAMFGDWGPYLMLNPVAPILEGISAVVVAREPPPLSWVAYSAGWAVLTFVVARAVFRRLEPYFAESV